MPTAVPVSLTPLIGRETEVSSLLRLLDEARLVTLTGAGGSGKTRLAAEVANRAAPKFAIGVSWVELAPLVDPGLLPAHVVDALGLEHGARPPIDLLIDALREKQQLLVLDNCEHLVDACATLAERLLLSCPKLKILATSREALGVGGERAWLVPGLTKGSAISLFVDRAQAASASFRLNESNTESVAKICRRLDGLPLAIELAAARIRALPPEQLAERLDDAFRVLTSGTRTAVPRHRTLREAIEWSYNLLDDRERALLQRLAIFAGDFTLQAAEYVAADVGLDASDVLDTLAALVDKSLVVMHEEQGTARFALLETIRQFGTGKLKESGDFHRVCDRHAKTYMDLASQAAPHLITRDRPEWVERLHRELDNIRLALACTREEDVAAHLRFLGDLGWFWYSSGLWSEGRKWLSEAIALPAPNTASAERARVLFAGGVLASLQGDTTTAVQWLEESVAIFAEQGDETGRAYALAYEGVAWGLISDDRAEAPAQEALAFFRRSGDLYGLRLALVVLSTFYSVRKRLDIAVKYGEEAVDVARAYGLDRELAIALQVLGQFHLTGGDLQRASELYRECLAALRRDPSLFWIARALRLLALVHFRIGTSERGAFIMGASEAVRESIGAGLVGHDRALMLPALEQAKQALGDAAFDAAMNAGRDASLSDVIDQVIRDSNTGEFPVPAEARPAPAEPPLEVHALGPLEIRRDGKPVPDDLWRYAKPRELLLYLLSHPEGSTREQVGLVFWPDASSTQVKNNFHVMLHHVRKALGRADLIAFERDRYRIAWELGVSFDAREFEQRVRSALRAKSVSDLTEAIALYRGEFLEGEEVGDWHLATRDVLRRLHLDAVLLLGQWSLEQASYKEAAEWFRRAIAADPFHEESHRRLMMALSRGGQRSEALRQYDRLSQVLNKEMEAEPDRETKSLYDRLRRAEPV